MNANRYLLDTNTVSYLLKGRSEAARNRLESLRDISNVAMSSLTDAELSFGIMREPKAQVLQQSLNRFSLRVRVLPWRHEEAVVYGRLRALLERTGRPLAPLDMLIAAHALTLNAVLVTRDKAFAQVPDLQIENWATDL